MKDHPYIFIALGTCLSVFIVALLMLGIYLTATTV